MRYDIIYTVHIPGIGRLTLYFDTIRVHGFNIYISGHNEDRENIELTLDKLVYPDSHPEECGFCHIVAYTMYNETVPCNYYRSIH